MIKLIGRLNGLNDNHMVAEFYLLFVQLIILISKYIINFFVRVHPD